MKKITLFLLASLVLFAGCFDFLNNNNKNNGNDNGYDPPPPGQRTPSEYDFNANNLLQNVGNVTAVAITPHYPEIGKVTIYYNGSVTLPSEAGIYQVTFDVAATDGWKAATGLYAGKLKIYPENYFIFKIIKNLENFLINLPKNTADDPYYIVTDIQQFGGPSNSGAINSYGSLAFVINDLRRYVNLDLSGSGIEVIPQTVSLDGDYITCITLPDNVTDIGSYTAAGANLAEIKLDPANGAYTVENGVLYNKNKTVLIAYPAGKADASFTILNSVTGIRESAFRGCINLANITMPNNFPAIGKNAFESCYSLTGITIPDSVTDIGESAFEACASLENIIIPDGVTGIGRQAFYYCPKLKNVTIGNGVTDIGESAFFNCKELTGVTLGNKVTTIGKSAFYSCRLTGIIIPDSVTVIGSSAFSTCGLTSVTLSNNLTRIEFDTFYKCSILPSVTIPSSVTGIGYGAFLECNELVSVTFQGNIEPEYFSNDTKKPPFDGNLRDNYFSIPPYGGIGTYTRVRLGKYWSKNP